jgi:hypothetical protein
VPWSASSRAQAATAPGTVTACGEVGPMATSFATYQESCAAAGLRPEPFIVIGTEAPFGA